VSFGSEVRGVCAQGGRRCLVDVVLRMVGNRSVCVGVCE